MSFLVTHCYPLTETYGGRYWPPDPFMFHCAVMNGVANHGLDRQYLAVLEELEPPTIYAERENDLIDRSRYVIDNHPRASLKTSPGAVDGTRLRCFDARGVTAPITYIWNLGEDSDNYRQLIPYIETIFRLGRGTDAFDAFAEVVEEEPKPEGRQIWKPSSTGRALLRVPVSGTTRSLIERHDNIITDVQAGRGENWRRPMYMEIPYTCSAESIQHYGTWKIQGPRLRLNSMTAFVAELRAALAQRCQDLTQDFIGSFIMCHPQDYGWHPDRRLSYIPAPSVWRSQFHVGIGNIIVRSRRCDATDFKQVSSRLDGLVVSGRTLYSEKWRMEQRYCGEGKTWLSTTPVVLPYANTARAGVEKALRHASIDGEINWERSAISKVPLFHGQPRLESLAWNPPAQFRGKRFVYARLEFQESVRGPLALGDGRHQGFGTMIMDPISF